MRANIIKGEVYDGDDNEIAKDSSVIKERTSENI
jgi:hypothetical protein